MYLYLVRKLFINDLIRSVHLSTGVIASINILFGIVPSKSSGKS